MKIHRHGLRSFVSRSENAGFTLIELLVVIAIIGLLAAVVLAAVGTARTKGVDASVKSQLNSARSQMELYASNHTTGYTGGCNDTSANTGLGGTASGGIVYNAASVTGNAARIVTNDNAQVGRYNYVTCHDSFGAWAAEAPLTASASGAIDMWCVDSNGSSKEEKTTNLQASTYVCP